MHRATRSKSLSVASGSIPGGNAGSAGTTRASAQPSDDPPLSPEKLLHAKSLQILELIESLKIDFGTFVHGVCYGNPESRDDMTMRAARRSFVQTSKLSDTLKDLYKPPRPPRGGGTPPTTARDTLMEFASSTMLSIYKAELKDFAETYRVPKEVLVNPDELEKINSDYLHAQMSSKCKNLYKTLATLAGDKLDENAATPEATHGIQPHPHFVSII